MGRTSERLNVLPFHFDFLIFFRRVNVWNRRQLTLVLESGGSPGPGGGERAQGASSGSGHFPRVHWGPWAPAGSLRVPLRLHGPFHCKNHFCERRFLSG